MNKLALTGAATIALATVSSIASASRVFVESATFDLGGSVLKAEIYTTSAGSIASGSNYSIDAIGGEFIEAGTSQGQPSLWVSGVQFGSAGNTATDNTWLAALTGSPHLSTGGFAFTYGPDPADRYQVFYAGGQYKGCWAVGSDCIVLIGPVFSPVQNYPVPSNPQPTIPEPGEWAMMLLGTGIVGWQIKRRQAKPAIPTI